MTSNKMMISGFLVISIVLGLCHPVWAQTDTLYVESNGSRILEVNVSTEFTIDIWIRDLSAPATVMYFTVVYDPDSMEVVGGATTPPNGWGAGTSNPGPGQIAYIASGAANQSNLSWYSLTFHCTAEGNTPINVIDAVYTDASGGNRTLNVLKASVNQVTPPPVGGITVPINDFAVLAPYILLAGLITVVSAVYVLKKRRD